MMPVSLSAEQGYGAGEVAWLFLVFFCFFPNLQSIRDWKAGSFIYTHPNKTAFCVDNQLHDLSSPEAHLLVGGSLTHY